MELINGEQRLETRLGGKGTVLPKGSASFAEIT